MMSARFCLYKKVAFLTTLNMAVTIDDFSYTIGRDGDMKYSITLSEVKLI